MCVFSPFDPGIKCYICEFLKYQFLYGLVANMETLGPDIYTYISMLKSVLVNKYFQTRHLIGWQHSRQPFRNHVNKSSFTDIDFSIYLA